MANKKKVSEDVQKAIVASLVTEEETETVVEKELKTGASGKVLELMKKFKIKRTFANLMLKNKCTTPEQYRRIRNVKLRQIRKGTYKPNEETTTFNATAHQPLGKRASGNSFGRHNQSDFKRR